MKKYINKICRFQSGFTIIELLIAIAIGGIVGAAIISSIAQTVLSSGQSNSLNTAINNVRYAGEYLSRDIRGGGAIYSKIGTITYEADGSPVMSGTLTPVNGDPLHDDSIEMYWLDAFNNEYYVSYLITADGSLQRDYNGSVSIVAASITSIQYDFYNNKTATLDITAGVEDMSCDKIYEVSLRN